MDARLEYAPYLQRGVVFMVFRDGTPAGRGFRFRGDEPLPPQAQARRTLWQMLRESNS